MRIRSGAELRLKRTDEIVPTLEVDIQSLPSDRSFPKVLADAAESFAEMDPGLTATIFTYFSPSVNFGTPTSSVFIMAVDDQDLLESIESVFALIPGVRVRPGDYLRTSQGLAQVHIQEGTVWRPLDVENWYAEPEQISQDDDAEWNVEDDELETGDHEDDQDLETEIRTTARPVRMRAARADASVGSIIRSIERIFGLPEGSVVLCGPDKKALRRSTRIATLRKRWED